MSLPHSRAKIEWMFILSLYTLTDRIVLVKAILTRNSTPWQIKAVGARRRSVVRENLRRSARVVRAEAWKAQAQAHAGRKEGNGSMARLHLLIGLISLAAFLASGQYMDLCYDHLRGLDDATRMLFRSTHIYLLFTALLNLVLGVYLPAASPGWRCWLQRTGSLFLLAAPLLLGVAFLTEPWLTGLERPYTQPAVIGCLVGVLLHVLSRIPRRPLRGASPVAAQ